MTLSNDLDKLRSKMSDAVKQHWKVFLFEGILLVVLGIAAILVPALASLAITIFLGVWPQGVIAYVNQSARDLLQ